MSGGGHRLSSVPPPSRNDIRERAIRFARTWESESRERGEAQSFWTDFLQIFGVQRRRANAAFERHARRGSTGGSGFIDLLWPGMLLAEQKSRGSDLDAAMTQALDYIEGLPEKDMPRLVAVSDFARLGVLDLEEQPPEVHTFALAQLPREIDRFLTLAGYATRRFGSEDAVNIKAAELLGSVYDEIAATGYPAHGLRVLIVRILFLLFGDDTGLWPRNQFSDLLRNRTAEDGSDLGMWLVRLFSIVDTPEPARTTALDEDLAAFPYVNGGLYAERFEPPDTTRSTRERLLEASAFDWSQISPAVFGSMFQSVMDPAARRAIGAHYTSEANIMKLIRPLFLDALEVELAQAGISKRKLHALHEKLGSLTFFDPACGCGNFLVLAYRELRRLEGEILLKLNPGEVQLTTALNDLRKVTLDQFHGVELEEFPARIAETAMYLIDHLENERLAASFGVNFPDLPLSTSANIVCGNALRISWDSILDPQQCSFVLGNPPYGGKHLLNQQQAADLAEIFEGISRHGSLDYVAGWFKLAAEYAGRGSGMRGAFVATNSITQGEQVPVLWPLLHELGLHIEFGWRTFSWTSEARGTAHVHVVIVGFVHASEGAAAVLYEYDPTEERAVAQPVSSVNGYLVGADEIYPAGRSQPLVRSVPRVVYGSKPADGGHLLLDERTAEEVRANDAVASRYIRPLLSASEYLNGRKRFCFWLVDADPADIRSSAVLHERLRAVHEFRMASAKKQTKEMAATPGLFAEVRRPDGDFVFVPIHASASRRLIPMGFVDADECAVVHNSGAYIEMADKTLFGLLQSEMFAVWQRCVGGRIKSDYRFNNRLVYNNFPFPILSAAQQERIDGAVKEILDCRSSHPDNTLAELYDPVGSPAPLVKAHRGLDRAVDSAFGRRAELNESERLAMLFAEYARLTGERQLSAV
jgi:hypothetical protein